MNADGCWPCGLEKDYYRFFELDRQLSIDLSDLQRRYYSLSRLVHPDHFARGTPNEKRFALDATAILNDAFRTLRDPITRAEYLLKEEGIEPAHDGAKRVPPELLEEVFDVRMALEGDAAARATLASSLDRFRALRGQADRELESLFQLYDAEGNRETLVNVRAVLDRRKYIANLIAELEEGLLHSPNDRKLTEPRS